MKYGAWALLILIAVLAASSRVDAQATETPTPTATLSPTPSATGPAAPQLYITPQIVPTNTLGPGPKIDGCGSPFIPCGPLPWPVIRWSTPNIPSPTAVPTIPTSTPVPATATFTATATATASPTNFTPSATWTPSATLTPTTEGGLEGVATLAGEMGGFAKTLQAQLTRPVSVAGTQVGLQSFVHDFGRAAGDAVRVTQSFMRADPFTYGALSLLIVTLAVVLLVELASFVLPLIVSFLKFLMSLWNAIKPF